MTAKTKLTILIGRMSPFHNGHEEIIERAIAKSDIVLILIGSINQARNPKNPWTFTERKNIIEQWAVNKKYNKISGSQKVHVLGIQDYPYSDQLWIANVCKTINDFVIDSGHVKDDIEFHITGADRDESTFYLKFFPSFKSDIVDENKSVSKFLTATMVREIYFGRSFEGKEISLGVAEMMLKSFVPTETIQALIKFEQTSFYDDIREEHLFNIDYRKPYTPRKPTKDTSGNIIDLGLPYEVIFQTVDACVIQTGHVLLIKRKSRPGKGLWALPGGFLNPRERLLDAAIRELREETKIKVPDPILRSSMIFKEDFDYPDRSLRGRTISKGFLFKLPDFVVNGKIEMPYIKGADDAEKAAWVPINEALEKPEMFFEDHFHMLSMLLGKL